LNKVISNLEISDKLLNLGVIVTPKNLAESRQYHLSAVAVATAAAKIINSNKK
jgi:hypothetical protein